MPFEDILKGAGSGAAMGSQIAPGWGTAIGGALGAIGGGILGREEKQTPMQSKQQQLIDQLLSSLSGEGQYADLFNVDEASFNRSFRDPMMAQFKQQVAPQIQQSFISQGQQRGTGLEDTLTRAGVNMDQMLNQYYYQAQQDTMNRQMNVMGNILGQGAGAPATPSLGQAALQGVGGYMTSDAFGQDIGGILRGFRSPQEGGATESIQDTFKPPRKGFEREMPVYNPYTGIQE